MPTFLICYKNSPKTMAKLSNEIITKVLKLEKQL